MRFGRKSRLLAVAVVMMMLVTAVGVAPSSAAPISGIEISDIRSTQTQTWITGLVWGDDFDGTGDQGKVFVRVRREADGMFWNGSEWSANVRWLQATLAAQGDDREWEIYMSGQFNVDTKSYRVHAYAIDADRGVQPRADWASSLLTIDKTPPTVSIDDPGVVSQGMITLTGAAADDHAGIRRVSVVIKRLADGFYWHNRVNSPLGWRSFDNRFSPSPTPNRAEGNEDWSFQVPVVAGTYLVTAWATDNESNLITPYSARPNVTLVVESTDSMPPDTAVLEHSVSGGQLSVRGASVDTNDVKRVRVRIRRESDLLFWNGSSWVASQATWQDADVTEEIWSLEGVPVTSGRYRVWAFGIDSLNNVETNADGRAVANLVI